MKKISLKKLSFDKLTISKLTSPNSIIGGAKRGSEFPDNVCPPSESYDSPDCTITQKTN